MREQQKFLAEVVDWIEPKEKNNSHGSESINCSQLVVRDS